MKDEINESQAYILSLVSFSHFKQALCQILLIGVDSKIQAIMLGSFLVATGLLKLNPNQ